MRKTYKGLITKLEPNQIFVFGSNTQGRHGAGAALWAVKNAGAVYGQSTGLQGNAYAIITKDLTKTKHPSVSKEYIVSQIMKLLSIADLHPTKEYIIAYSGIGVNLNGYTPQEMAELFRRAKGGRKDFPDNIIFEENFNNLI